jgi:hypothetical protein
MLQVANQLRRAGIIHTVPGDFPFDPLHRLPASRADRWRLPCCLAAISCIDNRANHVRDHFTGSFDQYTVANPNILIDMPKLPLPV